MTTKKTIDRIAVGGFASIVAAFAFSAPAHATNGYFANGYNAESKAMAGAGVAVDNGVIGLAQNPALGNKVGNGAEGCISLFAPDRGFTIGGAAPLTPGSYRSENDMFVIPCGGANFRLNDRSTLGFLVYGNGGMNTEYIGNPFAGLGAGSSPLGVNLEQVFMSLSYSFEVNESLTLGFAPIFAAQRFSATGLEAFIPLSSNPAGVTNNGDDWSHGWGANLGLVWQPSTEWTLGASYRTKIEMDPFTKYSGLYAEQGDFDIPATATLGAAYTPASNSALTLSAEFQRIFYNDVAAIANSGALLATPLGAANGPGFGWKDMNVVRIAAIYQANSQLTLRGGVSYATDFIEPNEVLLNVLAPATINWHASIGASYKMTNGWELSGAYTHALDSKMSGANLTPGFGQPVTLDMSQNELTFGVSYEW
ncbi:MAG: outer membrane protein transport protein [Antarcticimicrobium sp.]|uniref:OmpP1/FadL family transporter n=1 Tax=Antarcticimicrobium sp. TaxID=2824147 RepID=UPI002605F820|nr:outer membrane protein transport protein [Antarcticimicrobium sp.]MDF1718439.1 outer membrane protein transport protein [Antarcticimicrobium sp.]